MFSAKTSVPVDVLHVEDDAAWARMTARWFQPRGVAIHHVSTGAELFSRLETAPTLPRCILLDVVLKGENGLALCDLLKGSPRYQAIPVILLTGKKLEPVAFLSHQALYRVEKRPDCWEELSAVIDAILVQQMRDRGTIDVGDLRLDPTERAVHWEGRRIVNLAPGPFSALCLLARSSPGVVPDETLYQAFLSRHSYRKPDHELAVRHVLRNYVSTLRHSLGERLGERIARLETGYLYRAAN